MPDPTTVYRRTVYGGHGDSESYLVELDLMTDRMSVQAIMRGELVCARPDLDVARVVELMVHRHIGCLPVVDDRLRPVGIVTKFDLVEQIDAAMRLTEAGDTLPTKLRACTAEDVMMPFALSLDEHATIEHAAAMMVGEDTHHVLVVSRGELVGVVSALDIARWVKEREAAVRRDGSRPPVWHPFEN